MTLWLKTPPGQYLLAWEQAQLDVHVADVFGFHALQLGLPELDALRANRMPHRWLGAEPSVARPDAAASPPDATANDDASIAQVRAVALRCDFDALPFPSSSLDLVVLPHALELTRDPHRTLREVERVLVPEGQAVICGFNSASLWGLRQRRARLYRKLGLGQLYLPADGDFIGYLRLRDWLRLLSFEVESSSFGCYRPAVNSEATLGRFGWMEQLGARCWPILGAVYFVTAVKRVRGMRLLEANWKGARKLKAAPVPLANRRPRRPVHEPAHAAQAPPSVSKREKGIR